MNSSSGDHRTSEPTPAMVAVALPLRVAEARVEDIGHAVARVAPADLVRLGAQPGDVLRITGGTSAVARAELSDDEHEGVIQIDGTTRSNCGAGLQEQVSVTIVETAQAVAVRFTPLWAGAPPAIIAPERMLQDLEGVPVIVGLRSARTDVRQSGELSGGPHDSVRRGHHREAHGHPRRRRRANRSTRSGSVV